MLTQGEDVEAHALAGRGRSISAIARHLERARKRARKTVRAYVRGERTASVRRSAVPDPLEPFVSHLAARFADDLHLWLPALFDEVRQLGYPRSYPSFVQMALKLVLEPIFEADFYPSSYGYRLARRAQDAIAEIVHFAQDPSAYEWVVEADIEACFDRIDHGQLMAEVGRRIGDRRVLALVRAFLRAGVMRETGSLERTMTGTPQSGIIGIISPLLANVALTALDRRYAGDWADLSRYQGRREYPCTERGIRRTGSSGSPMTSSSSSRGHGRRRTRSICSSPSASSRSGSG